MFDCINAHVSEIGSKNFIDEPTIYEMDIDRSKALHHCKQCVKYQEASIKKIDDPIIHEDGTMEIWYWRTSPTSTRIVACCYKERKEKAQEETV